MHEDAAGLEVLKYFWINPGTGEIMAKTSLVDTRKSVFLVGNSHIPYINLAYIGNMMLLGM